MTLTLAFETSCDDTCVCIFDSDENKIRANLISRHIQKNGIIPENVARCHVVSLPVMVKLALEEANLSLEKIDLVAATYGPGLIGSLVTGLTFGKTIAWALGKPFFAAHHIEGHILSAKQACNLTFPYGCLVISGGHTLLCVAESLGKYKIIGSSIDDAAGECFDKVAREIGLEQPGGPAIEKIATPDQVTIPLPNPLPNSFNFSFSGLKTAAKRSFNGTNTIAVASSLQEAITRSLSEKIRKFCQEIVPLYRLHRSHDDYQPFPIAIVGGVAANRSIFTHLSREVEKYNCELFAPPIEFCTDNALMIAYQAASYAEEEKFSPLSQGPVSKISIEKIDKT